MILASSGPPGGPLEGLLGCLGGLLGASWAVLGHLEAILGRLGLSWAVLEAVLDHLGRTWRPSWTILEAIFFFCLRANMNLRSRLLEDALPMNGKMFCVSQFCTHRSCFCLSICSASKTI